MGLKPNAELLYVASPFHDLGLVAPYKSEDQRFELDGAAQARAFLTSLGRSATEADTATAGVETDVLGLRLHKLTTQEVAAITGSHPRPNFKERILEAFANGFKDRPDTTFGTVNADVLEHFVPGYRHIDFVDVIRNSAWNE